ncbi:MAG: LPS export ABC transporter ATP-binding protein [Nitrospirae bacterium GWC2_56_14]|jgi:lipopolysaccharide export system ATP-binding protein|nr:MAG: LPS export ABC transporter ATP-binding protein [Nitrospirae bacterium GWC2_56_14]
MSMQALEANKLEKGYRGRKIVRGVSLQVRSGEVVGLLGPNGAGKTTTFYMVVGLVRPDQGSVVLDGTDITKMPMYQRARKGIGYLPQEPSVFRKLTVAENLTAVLETLDLSAMERNERRDHLMSELGVTHLANSKAYTLSGGERRRVEIARALTLDPKFILLDEPFAGIDPLAVQDIQGIISLLKSKGIGILITDHNVRETLAITDRAYIISDGTIIEAGTAEEIMASPQVRQFYLGEAFKL